MILAGAARLNGLQAATAAVKAQLAIVTLFGRAPFTVLTALVRRVLCPYRWRVLEAASFPLAAKELGLFRAPDELLHHEGGVATAAAVDEVQVLRLPRATREP